MVRKEMSSMKKAAVEQMTKETRAFLNGQDRAHFNYKILYEAEIETLRVMESRISELTDGFLKDVEKAGENGTTRQMKRENEGIEGDAIEEDRVIKRQRTDS
ncbi:uncharacterized protein CTRU02_210633 [Colletotrichum truncatum]|uniref:Uncharacterized protein n=1 Tax=Colletotrichum truncatum TaxID=5467 RepID=A0ACC3YPJ2_COLTU|nr:uncharacterized protein CTRU02_03872 [Colletotrichum truncatum]KAF6796894.1 hypothetical protein CTRU02_03872 [Colletotrichum truncatum]